MDEEVNSKQEEARRILESIRQKEPLDPDYKDQEGEDKAEKVIPRLPSQDAAELEALITTTILSKTPPPPEEKKEEEIPDVGEINPISNEQIKVMRKFAATKTDVSSPATKLLAEFFIRAYYEFVAWLTPASKVQRCQKEGHICINCGTKIPFVLSTAKKEEEDETAAKKHA